MIIGMTAARRVMRRHQGLELPPRHRLPLWRLLLGELSWALRQLWEEPRVLIALAAGAVATFAVLGEPAPGPVLPLPGRLLVSLIGGLALARGMWAWTQRGRTSPGRTAVREDAPAIAATEVVGLVAAVVLLVWLVLWVATALS